MIKTRLVTHKFPHTSDSRFWAVYDLQCMYYWRNAIVPRVDLCAEYRLNGKLCKRTRINEPVVRIVFCGKSYFVDSHLSVHEIL